MSTKHTPGPWYWDNRYPASEGRKTWSLIGINGYGILSCDGEENSPQGLNDLANARLIAAAPELLDALILLEQEMLLSGNAGSEDYGWKPAIEKTRAAIAKAVGAA